MLIRDFVKNNGVSSTHIAKCCGLERHAVYTRLNGETAWKVVEVPGLSQALRLPKETIVEMILEEERYGCKKL